MEPGDFLILHEETDGNDEMQWAIQNAGPDSLIAHQRYDELKEATLRDKLVYPEMVGDEIMLARIWKKEEI